MTTAAAVITALGTLVVGVLAFIGTVLTIRATRSAARHANEQEAESVELAAWRDLAGEYRTDRGEMRERLSTLEQQMTEQATALRGEQLKREGMARELDRERERLTLLESRFRAAVAYIQSLWTLLRHHDIEPPPPPEGLRIEL